MKIISKYKDFYDYCAGKYGIDHRIIYNRNEIQLELNVNHNNCYFIPGFDRIVENPNQFSYIFNSTGNYEYKFLIICGRQYLLVKRKPKLTEIDKFPWELYNPEVHDITLEKKHLFRKPKNIEYYTGQYNQHLDKLSKFIKHPVFIVYESYWKGTFVEKRIPNLGKLGFGSIMTAEKLYQEIEYYFTNTLRDNPDVIPPVNVSDKDQIIAKGFDIKTSFRGTNK